MEDKELRTNVTNGNIIIDKICKSDYIQSAPLYDCTTKPETLVFSDSVTTNVTSAVTNAIEECFKTSKKKEKKMRTEQIVDLWVSKSKDNMYKCYKKENEKILEKDIVNQKIRETIHELDEFLKEYELSIFDKLPSKALTLITDESKLEIQKIQHKHEKDMKDLLDECIEIKAMLSACETYEQEIEILKNYSVISLNGTINPWVYE